MNLPPKRTFRILKRDQDIVELKRDHIRFEGSWVMLYNGSEYQVPTDVYALPADRVFEVSEILPDPPVAPPLCNRKCTIGRPDPSCPVHGNQVYDPDDDEYHPRE